MEATVSQLRFLIFQEMAKPKMDISPSIFGVSTHWEECSDPPTTPKDQFCRRNWLEMDLKQLRSALWWISVGPKQQNPT